MTDQTKAAPMVTDEQIHAAMSRAGNANSEEWGMEVCRDIAAQVSAPLIAEREAIVAKLAEAQWNALDAERYRKLRAQTWNFSNLFVVAGGKDRVKLGTNCPSLGLLDAAVDALPAIVKEHE